MKFFSIQITLFVMALMPVSAAKANELTGVWKGTYECQQGHTGATLTFNSDQFGNTTNAQFDFYTAPGGPQVPNGSFVFDVIKDGDNLQLKSNRWINRPLPYVMVDIQGRVNSQVGYISGRVLSQGCREVRLDRVNKTIMSSQTGIEQKLEPQDTSQPIQSRLNQPEYKSNSIDGAFDQDLIAQNTTNQYIGVDIDNYIIDEAVENAKPLYDNDYKEQNNIEKSLAQSDRSVFSSENFWAGKWMLEGEYTKRDNSIKTKIQIYAGSDRTKYIISLPEFGCSLKGVKFKSRYEYLRYKFPEITGSNRFIYIYDAKDDTRGMPEKCRNLFIDIGFYSVDYYLDASVVTALIPNANDTIFSPLVNFSSENKSGYDSFTNGTNYQYAALYDASITYQSYGVPTTIQSKKILAILRPVPFAEMPTFSPLVGDLKPYERVLTASTDKGKRCALIFSEKVLDSGLFNQAALPSDIKDVQFFTGETLGGRLIYCAGSPPAYFPAATKSVGMRLHLTDDYLQRIGYSSSEIKKIRDRYRKSFVVDLVGKTVNGRFDSKVRVDVLPSSETSRLFNRKTINENKRSATLYTNQGLFYTDRDVYLRSLLSTNEKNLVDVFDMDFKISAEAVEGSKTSKIKFLGSSIDKEVTVIVDYDVKPKSNLGKKLSASRYSLDVVFELKYKEDVTIKGLGRQTDTEVRTERFRVNVSKNNGYKTRSRKRFRMRSGGSAKVIGFEAKIKKYDFAPKIYIEHVKSN